MSIALDSYVITWDKLPSIVRHLERFDVVRLYLTIQKVTILEHQ